jgi:hypothetical protein
MGLHAAVIAQWVDELSVAHAVVSSDISHSSAVIWQQ